MVLMIQLTQCVHAELKLKPLNISSCDCLFENLKKIDPNFFNLNEKDQINVLLYAYQRNKPKSFNQSILNNVTSMFYYCSV